MELTEQNLKEIFAHAEEGYPDEVCGIVIGKPGDPKSYAVRRCANLANRYHQQDPVRYPRDAKTAYILDPKALLIVQAEADGKGLEIILIYHSHTDHEAYFSKTDRELALFDGQPLWPGARYMVVSVKSGIPSHFKLFGWDALRNDFMDESFEATAEHGFY